MQGFCNATERVISLGARWYAGSVTSVNTDELTITDLAYVRDASSRPTGGFVRGGNDTNGAHTLTLHLLCIAP